MSTQNNLLREHKNKLIHQIKERGLLLRHYKLDSFKVKPNYLIATFDEKRKSMGLADRLKGIVSLYAYCKSRNFDFKCNFNHPFNLEKYLAPNKYNWTINKNDLSDSVYNTRILILHGENGKRLLKFKPRTQTHVYINRDYLPLLNERFNVNFQWGKLFNELFIPTQLLQERLDYYTNQIGQPYIVCQLRFMSLLGDFKEYDQLPLPENEQKSLIEMCTNALIELKTKHNLPLLVISDSMKFVSQASTIDGIIGFPEEIVHIDCADNSQNDQFLKTFVDFFLISNAKHVFNITAKGMYPSDFPNYASKIKNVSFQRVAI